MKEYSVNAGPRVHIQELDSGTHAAFSRMTFPRYRSKVTEVCPTHHLRLAAFSRDKPIGLLLGEIKALSREMEILSLFVIQGERRKGVATALLQEAERILVRNKVKSMALVFMEKTQTPHPLRPLLASQQWNSPEIRMVSCFSPKTLLSRGPWVKPYVNLSPRLVLKAWVDLTAEERKSVYREDAPEVLKPNPKDRTLEPVSSIVVFEGKLPIGWMINHEIDSDRIRFSHLWVRSGISPRQLNGIALVGHSIHRWAESPACQALVFASMNFQAHNRPMWNFLTRHLKPYLDDIRFSFGARKELTER